MKKTRKWRGGAVCGAVYAAMTLFSARGLIRGLGWLAGQVGQIAGLEDRIVEQAEQILGQLMNAAIVLPWAPVLLIGAAVGALLACLPGRWIKRILLTVLAIVMFLPLTLVVVWFTGVNSVRVGAVLRILIRLAGKMIGGMSL